MESKFDSVVGILLIVHAVSSIAFPPTTVIPPKDLQSGEIFKGLTFTEDTFVLNQEFDLARLGPGSNIVFVTNGTQWGFAFSNGRFDAEDDKTRLKDKSYPTPFRKAGKYPWPRATDGSYLDASRLVTSNGPHSHLGQLLGGEHLVAGHVGIDLDGHLYLGYVSGVNRHVPLAAGEEWMHGNEERERILPASARSKLHEGLKKAFSGRDIDKLLAKAPTDQATVKTEGTLEFFPKKPSLVTPAVIQTEGDLLKTLLAERGENLDKYVSQLDWEKKFWLLTKAGAAGAQARLAMFEDAVRKNETSHLRVSYRLSEDKDLLRGFRPELQFWVSHGKLEGDQAQLDMLRDIFSTPSATEFREEFETLVRRSDALRAAVLQWKISAQPLRETVQSLEEQILLALKLGGKETLKVVAKLYLRSEYDSVLGGPRFQAELLSRLESPNNDERAFAFDCLSDLSELLPSTVERLKVLAPTSRQAKELLDHVDACTRTLRRFP